MLFVVLISVAILDIYLLGTRNFNYWKNKGIKYEKPTLFFGNSLEPYLQNICQSDWFVNLYRRYPDDKYVGCFLGNKPALFIRDPELVKRVLVSNFSHFSYRGLAFGKNDEDTLSKSVLTADGDLWKLLRQKLTPAFSSGKLKAMFPLIVEQTNKLITLGEQIAQSGDELDMRELMARYTTDFIGACGFGIDSHSLFDDSSHIRDLGKRIFTLTPRLIITILLKSGFPNIFKKLTFLDPAIEKEIIDLVKQIMAQRNYEPSTRNDFIDIMLELRKKKKMIGESIENFNPDGSPEIAEIPITDLLIVAQVFIFFAAGFETSSYASSILLHNLAFHPKEQARCQKEIDEVLARHEGKLSYDSLNELKYIEMALKESMRIMPSPSAIGRLFSMEYTFPGTNLTIDKNVLALFSTEAMHLDEQYFEDPEEFIPERFHPDNIGKIPKFVYLPFGDGPRACIGERLGIMQSLAGVAKILSKFSVAPCKNSIRKPHIDIHSGVVKNVTGGLPLALNIRT